MIKRKTLFISDLDGTLLSSEQKFTSFTANGIKILQEKGINFTFATARSLVSTRKVIGDVKINIPMVLHNGSFLVDAVKNKRIIENLLPVKDSENAVKELLDDGILPMVYTLIEDEEKFLYAESRLDKFTLPFVEERLNDPRRKAVQSESEMLQGKRYYITAINEKEKLLPFFEKYKDKFHLILNRDFYSKDWWLEFLPQNASKAQAALQLKNLLGCDKIVSFGDGVNDIELFKASDECYAVENADENLKNIATEVIGHHNDNSVIKWLLEKAEKYE
ncbi:MAG: HAD family hydrolase [Ruminococcaceae bacterium]|nr:HAD family hydrolase [Oscillospiraceae bacterium]